MKITMVRYKVKADTVKANETELKKVVEALEKAKPEDFRFTALKLSDGVSFIAISQGDVKILHEIEANKQHLAELEKRLDGEIVLEEVEEIGSYKLFE